MPSASAARYAAYGVSSEITVWIVGSSAQNRLRPTRAWPIVHAIASPSRKPPPEETKNCSAALLQLKAPVIAAAIANLNAISPDASLIRLSPSTIVDTREGIASFEVTALTATASVGEITAPSANAAASGSSGTSQCIR